MAVPDRPRARLRLLAIESATAQRRAGRVMVGVAIVGVLVAATGALLGWHLVGELDTTSRETLEVTVESLDSLAATIELADRVLGSTVEALEAVGQTLDALAAAFDSGSGVITEVGGLAEAAAPALAQTTTTLRDLEQIAGAIDATLRAVSRVPLGPSYDPDAGFGETIGSLADTLEPLSVQFATASSDLATFTGDIAVLREAIAALNTTVADVNAELAGTDTLIDEYRVQLSDARQLAEDTGAGVAADTSWMRLLIVVAAVNFAVGQIVPLWIGNELLQRSRERLLVARTPLDPTDDEPLGPDGGRR